MAYFDVFMQASERESGLGMVQADKKLVLVDGSSYLFRAYYALPPLTTSKGLPTGAIYGVINMLRKLLKEEKPDYIVVVFDTKSPNFRHRLYEGYKANRAVMADDLSQQIAPLHEVIRAMGLPLLAIEGIEADDVIATLAHQASRAQVKTLISTGDKDLAQLVNQQITLVNTMTGQVLDEKGVIAKFGVGPKQIIDYLTLIGDPVDNIPGIPKVGPKTAVKWLAEYGSLDEIIKNADKITGKVGDNLRQALHQLPLSKQLVTVQCDVELTETLDHFLPKTMSIERLKVLFQELEFKTWLQELNKVSQIVVAPLPPSETPACDIILTLTQLQQWIKKISTSQYLVVQTHVQRSHLFQQDWIALTLTLDNHQTAYIPLSHDYLGMPSSLEKAQALPLIKSILEDPQIAKIGHHLKQDLHVLFKEGIRMQNLAEDIMLQSYVVNSVATRHDLKSLAEFYLQITPTTYEDLVGKGAKQISFKEVTLEKAAEYATQQAEIILNVNRKLTDQLQAEPLLNQVYREIELPLIEVLWQMETTGVGIDPAQLRAQSHRIAQQLKDLEEQAYILAGESFNLGSPKQLQTILYEKLLLPILEKTPKGAPSTAENVLQELSAKYELPKLILTHRTLSKLKSTYTDKLPEQIDFKTHRIHTSYQQAITATGRLSSTDPNLQNIPIRTEEGRKVRQAFIPAKGLVLLSADYSQIELRIMAHLSQDEGLLKAFSQGEDIHRYTASEVLGIPLEQVSVMQRRSAKAINFGLIYGMSSFGLARQLDIERSEAQQYMDRYFCRYPAVKAYMENTRALAADTGYVETIFGRRLYIPNIRSKNVANRKAAERAAINAPMQGTAADVIKKAMIVLQSALKDRDDIKMLLQVHDELVFEVQETAVEEAKALIQACMQNAAQLSVPLLVEIGVGSNWDVAH